MRFSYGINTLLIQYIRNLLSGFRRIGFSGGDGCDPWQTPCIFAVEAVESCSRPLVSEQSWCVHDWVALEVSGCPECLNNHLGQARLSREDPKLS